MTQQLERFVGGDLCHETQGSKQTQQSTFPKRDESQVVDVGMLVIDGGTEENHLVITIKRNYKKKREPFDPGALTGYERMDVRAKIHATLCVNGKLPLQGGERKIEFGAHLL